MFNNLTPIVKNLLLINIGVFVVVSMLLGLESAVDTFGLRYINSREFQPWQFITHMFMHGGWPHLFSNMIGLFFFGPMLERAFGPQKFLIYYFVCGLGAAFIYMGFVWYELRELNNAVELYLLNPDPASFSSFMNEYGRGIIRRDVLFNILDDFRENPDNPMIIRQTKEMATAIYNHRIDIPMVGASGAIFGILMGFALLFPNTELFLLFFPFPIKAKYMVLFYGLYTLYAGIQRTPGDNVAHFAHLGGMIFAFILIRYWRYSRYN
ncbi:MAG: rhomboid family intramembrane serine protease [Cytophagaceae bacterium]